MFSFRIASLPLILIDMQAILVSLPIIAARLLKQRVSVHDAHATRRLQGSCAFACGNVCQGWSSVFRSTYKYWYRQSTSERSAPYICSVYCAALHAKSNSARHKHNNLLAPGRLYSNYQGVCHPLHAAPSKCVCVVCPKTAGVCRRCVCFICSCGQNNKLEKRRCANRKRTDVLSLA